MAAIIDVHSLQVAHIAGLSLLEAPAVVPLYSGQMRALHEHASVEFFGRRLATWMGREFRVHGVPGLPAYFIAPETLTCEQASLLGITCAQDMFGGVVPFDFVASKLVTHGLVEGATDAPLNWARRLGDALKDVVLPGYSVFNRRDLHKAAQLLLEQGNVRIKLAQARGGNGQQVVSSLGQLKIWLAGVSDVDIADGAVVELNLESCTTFSIGCVEVADRSIAYFGTQRSVKNPAGDVVYGGSNLRVVRGGLEQLRQLQLTPPEVDAIAKVQHYETQIAQAYPGFFASRRNYDVVHGHDLGGVERCGVLEQSWRFGGASPAEILALEALWADPLLRWVDAMTYETWDDEPVPDDALVYFQGEVASLGRLTKYARVVTYGRSP